MTQTETIEALQKQLNDIEADIQAALTSMRSRVTDLRIVTHQRRDRPDEHGRPGFYREHLTVDRHVEAVIKRADMEKTTGSLNHKNWGSLVDALMDVSQGSIEDGNKIALRVDDLRNVLRMIHLLRQHLSVPLPAAPASVAAPGPEASDALKAALLVPPPLPPVHLAKPTPDLKPTPADGTVLSQSDNTPRSPLDDISFIDDPEGTDNDEEEEQDEDDEQEAHETPATKGGWTPVVE